MRVVQGAAMSRRYAVLLVGSLAVAAFLSLATMAQTKDPPWIAKDWTMWTAKDCQLVLNNSPWAHEQAGGVSMTERILSALPIREALLKQLQLDKHYDKMNAQGKLKFDQEHTAGLMEGYENRVVVEIVIVVWEPPPPSGSHDASASLLPGANQVALRRSDGSFVLPTEINVSDANTFDTRGTKTDYVFPRVSDGKPLFATNNSDLVIVLGIPLIVDKKTHKAQEQNFQPWPGGDSYSFKISEMMYKGKLEY
jgi:hypothetical protein